MAFLLVEDYLFIIYWFYLRTGNFEDFAEIDELELLQPLISSIKSKLAGILLFSNSNLTQELFN